MYPVPVAIGVPLKALVFVKEQTVLLLIITLSNKGMPIKEFFPSSSNTLKSTLVAPVVLANP